MFQDADNQIFRVAPKATKEIYDTRTALAPEIMEAIWVASEMRACAAYAHAVLAIDEMVPLEPKKRI